MNLFSKRFSNKVASLSPGGNAQDQSIRSSIATSLIADDSDEIDRITRYHLNWKFYNGKHYSRDNDAMISVNYVRAFIDKVNQFLLGDDVLSFQVQSYYSDVIDEDSENAVEKLIMGVWRKNNFKTIVQELLQMGSVCGDAWMGVFYEENKGIQLKLFDSRNCFAEFKEGDVNNLETFEVRTRLKGDDKYILKVHRFTKDKVVTWKQKHAGKNNLKDNEKFDVTTDPHSLGVVPVVHFKNRPASEGYYSTSDVEDILKINKVFNELTQKLKGIIDYHASPTTIVTGATTKNMSRGLGKVWSGLPSEANVFNLGLDFDLSTTMTFLDRLKTAMHEVSDIPEGVLGKIQAISGTSAAALKLTYQPIYQKASLKALTYGEGIRDVNNIILKYYDILKDGKINSMEAQLLASVPNDFTELFECVPVFSYGFPVDRLNQLQEAQLELGMDIASIKEIMNRLGKKNVPDLLEEIKNDKIRKAELESLIAQITTPNTPPTEDPNAEKTAGEETTITEPSNEEYEA